jgi:hypothetical protein
MDLVVAAWRPINAVRIEKLSVAVPALQAHYPSSRPLPLLSDCHLFCHVTTMADIGGHWFDNGRTLWQTFEAKSIK